MSRVARQPAAASVERAGGTGGCGWLAVRGGWAFAGMCVGRRGLLAMRGTALVTRQGTRVIVCNTRSRHHGLARASGDCGGFTRIVSAATWKRVHPCPRRFCPKIDLFPTGPCTPPPAAFDALRSVTSAQAPLVRAPRNVRGETTARQFNAPHWRPASHPVPRPLAHPPTISTSCASTHKPHRYSRMSST